MNSYIKAPLFSFFKEGKSTSQNQQLCKKKTSTTGRRTSREAFSLSCADALLRVLGFGFSNAW